LAEISLYLKSPVSNTKLVIAIDGPAASGKSTTAKLVAARLGYVHIDTGAMYRAVTLKVIRSGVDINDRQRIAQLVAETHVKLASNGGKLTVYLDGIDVTEEIRTLEVSRAVSAVSSLREVREAMVREQRAMGKSGGIVLDGRDIGTVVFPDADLKFFMVASIEARAHRRLLELSEKGETTSVDRLAEEIAKRDHLDSTRSEAPLKRADDAITVDTSQMTIEDQVNLVVTKAHERMEGR
jgi:CMP/dCMP kinase